MINPDLKLSEKRQGFRLAGFILIVGIVFVGVYSFFVIDDSGFGQRFKNWSTYQNKEYGFEFKHPVNWSVTEGNSGISFLLEQKEQMNVRVDRNGTASYLENVAKTPDCDPNQSSDMGCAAVQQTAKEITINSAHGYLVETELGKRSFYIASEQKNITVIISTSLRDEALFDAVVKSFRFENLSTSGVDTSNWKTYRNEKHGFEFRYPSFLNLEFEGDEISFVGNGQELSIEISADNSAGDVVEWADQSTWPFSDPWRNHFSVVELSGMKVLRSIDGYSATFKKNAKIFLIENGSAFEGAKYLNKEAFDQILSTFKFVKPATRGADGLSPNDERLPEFNYPTDYIFKAEEIPTGFKLENLSKADMQSLGLSSNPGFYTNKEIYAELYKGIDISKVKNVYGATYVVSDGEKEIGVLVVQYNTSNELLSELPKIKAHRYSPENRFIYSMKEDILLIVWSDDDLTGINDAAIRLRSRLGFEGI